MSPAPLYPSSPDRKELLRWGEEINEDEEATFCPSVGVYGRVEGMGDRTQWYYSWGLTVKAILASFLIWLLQQNMEKHFLRWYRRK